MEPNIIFDEKNNPILNNNIIKKHISTNSTSEPIKNKNDLNSKSIDNYNNSKTEVIETSIDIIEENCSVPIGGGIVKSIKDIINRANNNAILFQWLFINCSCLIVNRKLEDEFKFQKLPITLLTYQMIISTFLTFFCIFVLKLTPYNPLKLSDIFYKMGPFTALHALNHVINALIPVESVGITRTLTPLVVVIFQYFVLHVTFETGVYISVFIFSLGISSIYIGSTTMALLSNPNILGTSIGLASILAFQTVYAHRLFSTWLRPIDPLTILFYFFPGSLLIFIPSTFIFEGEQLVEYYSSFSNHRDLITMISLGGIVTFFTFYITFSINKKYDILTMALARNSKYMILKVHSNGVVPFLQTWNNFIGVSLCVYGILKYKKVNLEPIKTNKNSHSSETHN